MSFQLWRIHADISTVDLSLWRTAPLRLVLQGLMNPRFCFYLRSTMAYAVANLTSRGQIEMGYGSRPFA